MRAVHTESYAETALLVCFSTATPYIVYWMGGVAAMRMHNGRSSIFFQHHCCVVALSLLVLRFRSPHLLVFSRTVLRISATTMAVSIVSGGIYYIHIYISIYLDGNISVILAYELHRRGHSARLGER